MDAAAGSAAAGEDAAAAGSAADTADRVAGAGAALSSDATFAGVVVPSDAGAGATMAAPGELLSGDRGAMSTPPLEAGIAGVEPADPLVTEPVVVPARSRRRRPGVPVDAHAPPHLGAQTSPATRTAGSGEWMVSRRDEAHRTGPRRLLPAAIPPVVLGAAGLVLLAGLLFLLPGMFAGGGAASPAASSVPSGIVAGTSRPARTLAASSGEPARMRLYTVKRLDTLTDIARRFKISQEQLLCANRQLRNPDLLPIGQVLNIPPEDYTCPRAGRTPRPTRRP